MTFSFAAQYSLRLLRREWRAGELRVLFVAIALAVASVTAVGFFTDRVQQTLRQQANELLAADLVVSSDHPLRALFVDEARRLNLRSTPVLQFRSMALAGEQTHLVEIKAVAEGYPLRGRLRVLGVDGATPVKTGPPERGRVWVESDVLRRLNVRVGDALTLGAISLTIAEVIAYEPDRGGNMFNIAPRVMLNVDDVPATQLLQEGSRAQYQLLVAGATQAVADYRTAIEDRLERGERVVDVTDARQEVREALTRAQQFLGLAALVSVMLAGVAVAMAARRHVERHLDHCALMRCVGAQQSFITQVYVLESVWLGLLASFTGCVVGFAAHGLLVDVLGRLLVESLPAPSWLPVAAGVATGLITLLAFAVPPLLHLGHVTPLRVLRRDLGTPPAPTLLSYVLGAAALAGLLLWQAGSVQLGLYMLGGLAATALTLLAVAALLVRIMTALPRAAGVSWRFGFANVARRARGSVVQVLAFGIGMMALLLLTVVKSDLLAAWQGRLPPATPNRFIINIQPDQVEPLKEFFAQRGSAPPQVFPMVRARLTAVNGNDLAPKQLDDGRARRLAEREFNLSWSAALQREDNEIVAGEWWTAQQHGQALLSVEDGIAETLNLKVGDELTYTMAGEEKFIARVSNLRKVQWDSFRVNFFVVAPPGVLERYPASYITSFFSADDQQGVLNELLRQFPNFTLIDISSIMNKVRDIILRVTQAVQYVFLFTLVAGLVVLYAAIQATQDERRRETAVLRTLGANRRQLVSAVLGEYLALGVLAGCVAAFAATVLGYVLAERVLHVSYHFNGWVWVIGIFGGGMGVALAGFLGTRRIFAQPPLETLRGVEG